MTEAEKRKMKLGAQMEILHQLQTECSEDDDFTFNAWINSRYHAMTMYMEGWKDANKEFNNGK